MTSTNLDWISESARKNPEGMLLLAAAIALLLRKHAAESRPEDRAVAGWQNDLADFFDYEQPQSSETGRLSRAAQGAGEHVASVRERVSDTASGYASAVGGFIGGARRRVTSGSGYVASQARSNFQRGIHRVLQDQPLAIAFAGLAAGAALAAALPVTRIERNTLSPVGDRLASAASEGKRRLESAATAAGRQFQSAAAERGLNSESLRAAAHDLSETVSDAFMEYSGSASQAKANDRDSDTGLNSR